MFSYFKFLSQLALKQKWRYMTLQKLRTLSTEKTAKFPRQVSSILCQTGQSERGNWAYQSLVLQILKKVALVPYWAPQLWSYSEKFVTKCRSGKSKNNSNKNMVMIFLEPQDNQKFPFCQTKQVFLELFLMPP
jgi:hypothetical protein